MRFAYGSSSSRALHVDAHAAGAAGDRAHGRVEVGGASDPAALVFAISSSCLRVILPTLFVFGVPLPFSMPSCLADQHRRWRRLHDEGEAAIRCTP